MHSLPRRLLDALQGLADVMPDPLEPPDAPIVAHQPSPPSDHAALDALDLGPLPNAVGVGAAQGGRDHRRAMRLRGGQGVVPRG